MVRMFLPAACFIVMAQLRVAAPFTCTVQVPHRPTPQPNLVPVMSSTSRKYHNSGMSGSPSNLRLVPFTLSWIIFWGLRKSC